MIKYAHFQLTVRCNLNCSFCGQSRGMAGTAADEITPDEWLKYARELREINSGTGSIPEITLWGGEPMLYENFSPLARELHKQGHKLDVVTNATKLEHNADTINECFQHIFVSLDGMKDQHDAIRGKGVFDKVQENLKLLKNRRGKLIFLCTISDTNVDSAADLPFQMAELGADEVVLQQLMYLTSNEIEQYRKFSIEFFKCDYPELAGWERNDDLAYQEKLNRTARKIKENIYPIPVNFTPHAYWFNQNAEHCTCQEKRIHIRHDGNVGFCTDYFGFSAGNIKENSLKNILSSPQAQLFHQAVKENKLPICCHCPWRLQKI